MAIRKTTLKIRLPQYITPRLKWRIAINEELVKAIQNQKVTYFITDKLELIITLYLKDIALEFHDIDNRLKDIMDAMQGRAGGSKAKLSIPRIIFNDSQIFKVTIEKKLPTKQSNGLGHLIIRKYKIPQSKRRSL
jgi:Holliday junction resolvase RusA-like endonuclease